MFFILALAYSEPGVSQRYSYSQNRINSSPSVWVENQLSPMCGYQACTASRSSSPQCGHSKQASHCKLWVQIKGSHCWVKYKAIFLPRVYYHGLLIQVHQSYCPQWLVRTQKYEFPFLGWWESKFSQLSPMILDWPSSHYLSLPLQKLIVFHSIAPIFIGLTLWPFFLSYDPLNFLSGLAY